MPGQHQLFTHSSLSNALKQVSIPPKRCSSWAAIVAVLTRGSRHVQLSVEAGGVITRLETRAAVTVEAGGVVTRLETRAAVTVEAGVVVTRLETRVAVTVEAAGVANNTVGGSFDAGKVANFA